MPSASPTTSDAPQRTRALTRSIATWFARAARPLPWRKSRTGYTALVSEAMLQQTQVSRVINAYLAFMRRFPTVLDLAAVDEQEVLAHWQGLGYYRRARNLHAAARMVRDRFDGRVPERAEDLLQLPGVGRYTAGAIASIVFGERAPIVDGNVLRVLARLEGLADVSSREGIAWCWAKAAALADAASDPGATNEGLMELGAMVCTPRAPRCGGCPLAEHCIAFQRGEQERYPAPKPAAKQVAVHHHAVIIRRGGKILLERRPDHGPGLWSGMWQTPTIESGKPLPPRSVRAKLAVAVESLSRDISFEHHTTHRRITFHVFAARSRARRGTWREPHDLDDLPMSNPQRRIVKLALG